MFELVFLRKCLNIIVSYGLSEEHRTDALTSKTQAKEWIFFVYAQPFLLQSPAGRRERALVWPNPLSRLLSLQPLAVQIGGADCVDVCGQICNKKDLESCNGPNGYSVSVSDWLSRNPSILKECSLTSQYNISYLVLQSFKWWLEWRVIILVVYKGLFQALGLPSVFNCNPSSFSSFSWMYSSWKCQEQLRKKQKTNKEISSC